MSVAGQTTTSTVTPTPEKLRLGRLVLWIFLLSLVVRWIWVAHAVVSPIGDHHGYNRSAIEWLHTGKYRVQSNLHALKPPGYAAFLAVTYWAGGEDWRRVDMETAALWRLPGPILAHDWKLVGFVQAVMGALTSALVALLATRVVSLRVGITAGLLHTFWPTSVAYVPVLANDNLAVFLFVAGLNGLAATRDGRGLSRTALGCLAGLCYGGLMLVRPVALFLLPAWLLLASYDPCGRVRRLRSLVACSAAIAAVMIPWMWHTYSAGLGVGVFSSQGGYALWWGNNWRTVDGGNPAPPRFPGDADLSERERHRFFMHKALGWILQNPQRYAQLCRIRLLRFFGKQSDTWAAKYFFPAAANDAALRARYWRAFGNPEDADRGRALETRNRALHQNFRLVAAPLMAAALLLALLQPRRYAYAWLPLSCYVAGLALTVFAPRYRQVSDPLLLICLAGLIVDVLCPRPNIGFWRGRWPKLGLAGVAVAGSLFVHARQIDAGWYRLPALPEPQPAFTADLGPRVQVDLSPDSHLRRIASRTCELDLHWTTAGWRCDLRGTAAGTGYQYGGIQWPADGMHAVKLEVTWLSPENIEAIFLDGCDSTGSRCVCWQWRRRSGSAALVDAGRQTYVAVAGEHCGQLRPHTHDRERRVASMRLLVRLHPGTAAGFVLHTATIATVPPEAHDEGRAQPREPIDSGGAHPRKERSNQ